MQTVTVECSKNCEPNSRTNVQSTHWRQHRHPKAWQCNPHSSVPIECHAMGGAPNIPYAAQTYLTCDCHICGHFKQSSQRLHIQIGQWCANVIVQCFGQQPKELLAIRICWLMHQWDSCHNVCGDFSNCCNTFKGEHPWTSFNCICLIIN